MNLINNTPPGTNITYVHHNVDTSEVEVELSNGNEEDVYGKLLIAHYDSRGAMKDICIKDAFINGMNTTIYIFDGFESIQPDELIKVFLWDGISGIKPLTYEYRY